MLPRRGLRMTSLASLPSDVLKLILAQLNLMDVLRVCSTAKALAALLRQLHEIRMTSVGYASRTGLRPKAGLGRILEIPTLRLLELKRIPDWSLTHSRLLAAALRRHGTPPLTTLSLAQSNLGGDLAAALMPAIGENTSLKTLNLSNCHVNLRGTTAIANAIDANTTLTALDVSGNGFRQPSRAASNRSISFINACAKHPALTDLNLDYNGLDAGDVPAIGRLLAAGRIRTLSLRGNRLFGRTQKVGGLIAASSASIVDGGVQAFVDALAGDGTPLDAVVDIRNILVTAMPTEDTAYRTFCLQNKLDRWQELVSDAAARRGIRLVRGAVIVMMG